MLTALWLACAPAAPPPSPIAEVSVPAPSAFWRTRESDGPIGAGADRVWYFQSHEAPYGVWSRQLDGSRSPVHEIAGLNIIGQPSYWESLGDGRFIAKWDAPLLVEPADGGGLKVGWRASRGRWWSSRLIQGERLITARYRPDAAVVALSVEDGAELWRSALPRESQGVSVWADADTLYVSWTEYDPEAPTPTVLIPVRVRALSPSTGEALWTRDFAAYPGSFSASDGVVLATFDADLHFLPGAGGDGVVVPTGQPPTIYPGLLLADGVAYVALNDTVTAYGLDGAQRWQQPAALDGGPTLALDGDLLLVSTAHNSVVAFDRQSGAQRWELGTGIDPYRLTVTDALVLVDGGGTSAAVGRPVQLAPETATIRGRVTADCVKPGPVHVGGVVVSPDADGGYTATLKAAGVVTIQATVDPSMQLISEEYRILPGDVRTVTVTLDGRGAYEAPPLRIRECE